jgi:hypothetical protein
MRIMVLMSGLLACLALVAPPAQAADTPATFTDPVPYCQAVGAIDAPDARYNGPAVPDWMIAALYTKQEIAAQKDGGVDPRRSIVWRCMNGAVFGCVQANSPICGKANQDKIPTKAMGDFCAGQPNAEIIPLSVIGHENPMIYDWTCKGKEPTVTRQIFKVDAQGFPSELWDKIAPAQK